MDEYGKRYERIGEITVMDGAHQNEDMEITSSESSIKRRKVDSPEKMHSCGDVNDSSRTSDLKEESFVTDMSKFSKNSFRQTTPSSEVSIDSERMEPSTPRKKPASASSHCKQAALSKTPSVIEIEEFFSVAEKYEQKRFTDKYNYDIVKDVPLEGKYKWVKLKP